MCYYYLNIFSQAFDNRKTIPIYDFLKWYFNYYIVNSYYTAVTTQKSIGY